MSDHFPDSSYETWAVKYEWHFLGRPKVGAWACTELRIIIEMLPDVTADFVNNGARTPPSASIRQQRERK